MPLSIAGTTSAKGHGLRQPAVVSDCDSPAGWRLESGSRVPQSKASSAKADTIIAL
jgi:hypothetical protein